MSRYDGPFEIKKKKKSGDCCLYIEATRETKFHFTFHVSYLKPFS